MIEGLKVTIHGSELKSLCMKRAAFHTSRAEFYAQQRDALPDIDEAISGFTASNSSKKPQEMMAERIASHQAEAAELIFIAEHLDLGENYLLDNGDLAKLGIIARRY